MKTYQNFKELKKVHKELATELLEEKGKGEWQHNECYYHHSLVDFIASHEDISIKHYSQDTGELVGSSYGG